MNNICSDLDLTVPMERRSLGSRRQEGSDRRQNKQPVPQERRLGERRKTERRRQIDPTTCERDYTADEIQFMQALDAYKRRAGRMFPTCSEILEVIRSLGYERPAGQGASAAAEVETLATAESL